jgi:hypothetical protein
MHKDREQSERGSSMGLRMIGSISTPSSSSLHPGNGLPGRCLDELHPAFEGFSDVKRIKRCTRCVQLQFAFMHLDVTQMDPAAEPRAERVGAIYPSPDTGIDARIPQSRWFRGV